MTASDELVETTKEAITQEALRRSAIIESADYEHVERMPRGDLWIAIVIVVISLTAMYAGIWV